MKCLVLLCALLLGCGPLTSSSLSSRHRGILASNGAEETVSTTTPWPTDAPGLLTVVENMQGKMSILAEQIRSARGKLRHLDGVVAELGMNLSLATRLYIRTYSVNLANVGQSAWLTQEDQIFAKELANLTALLDLFENESSNLSTEIISNASQNASHNASLEVMNDLFKLEWLVKGLNGGIASQSVQTLENEIKAYRTSMAQDVHKAIENELPELIAASRSALSNLTNVSLGLPTLGWTNHSLGSFRVPPTFFQMLQDTSKLVPSKLYI